MTRWTQEQLLSLEDMAGTMPVSQISSQIGRSETAVRVKACRKKHSLSVQRETARGKRILKEPA